MTKRSTPSAQPADAAGNGALSIPCPKCKHLLVCAPELLGTRGRCRQCQHIFTISLDPEKASAAEPVGLVFSCPVCHQLFEGREDMRGRKGKCYACQAVFTITLREAATLKDTGVLADSAAPAQAGEHQNSRVAASAATPAQSTASPSSAPKYAAPKSLPKTKVPNAARRESAVPKTEKPQSLPQESDLAKFKLPKTQEPVLAGSTATEAAVLNPAALQRHSRRPAGDSGQVQTPIRFMCAQCHGLMEVPGTSAGMETACPYCQMVQTIPARSQEEYAPLEPMAALRDPLAEFSASPAALQNQWSVQSLARHRSALTVSNVFQIAFENLFPSCLVTLLHAIILAMYAAVGFGIAFGILLLLGLMGLPRETMVIAASVCFGIFGLVSLAVAAWFSASIRHMALRAVRKSPLDIGEALSPGGAYGVSLIIVIVMALLNVLAYAPELFNGLATLGMLRVLWGLAILMIVVIAQTLFSLAWFAAIDGDSTGEAIATSCRLILKHFPVMIGVKVLVWLITIPLAVLTLGFALVLPIYFNATLYHLGSKP